jgi:hypothetical protein
MSVFSVGGRRGVLQLEELMAGAAAPSRRLPFACLAARSTARQWRPWIAL